MISVFSHIEKCAGTSLTTKFRNELPFQSCDIVSKSNVVSKSELIQTKTLFPRLKIMSGHNLSSNAFDDIASVFGDMQVFTVVRDPVERLVSNYLHDKTRGVWRGTLQEYQNIPWKKNYLSRFIGGGDVENALSNLSRISYIITVRNLEPLAPLIFEKFGLGLSAVIPRQNTHESNKSAIPDDLSASDGVTIGKHHIAEDLHLEIVENNAIDIDLFQMLKENELNQFGMTQLPSKQYALSAIPRKLATIPALAYRNSIQKPLILGRTGYTALPRNATSPDKTTEIHAFK